MDCEQSRARLQQAYQYLSNSDLSSYKMYLQKQVAPPGSTGKIKYWQVFGATGNDLNMPLLECALWPVLYPFGSWCEVQVSIFGSAVTL